MRNLHRLNVLATYRALESAGGILDDGLPGAGMARQQRRNP
jgi:hypothetical protein